MDPSNNDASYACRFFTVYKDGHVKVHRPGNEKIPPSDDPQTGVRSKDVLISSESGVSARIFMPKIVYPAKKLPLLFHIHGGGFCMQSPFSPRYSNYVSRLAVEANVIAISVDYGLFPDRPIPACYEDSWVALQWVASHANGHGPDSWLNNHADFNRVFIGGESAGGNISHTMAVRVGSIGLPHVNVVGIIMVHPYFGGTDDDQMWLYMCPSNKGLDDPRMKPTADDLARLGCGKVLMFVAEKDHLFGPGKAYYERLKSSDWKGTVEIVENIGEGHVFHLQDLNYEKAVDLIKRLASFMNQE